MDDSGEVEAAEEETEEEEGGGGIGAVQSRGILEVREEMSRRRRPQELAAGKKASQLLSAPRASLHCHPAAPSRNAEVCSRRVSAMSSATAEQWRSATLEGVRPMLPLL